MIRVLCRVCGTFLSRDIVQCPRCETPHHRDCWHYNGGCALFACAPGDTAPVEAVPAPVENAPPPDTFLGSRSLPATILVSMGVTVVMVAISPVLGTLLVGSVLLGAVSWALSAPSATFAAREEDSWSLQRAEEIRLARATVTELVGRDETDSLAQVYALFEQRFPREALDLEAQRALTLELLDAGWTALGLEALDKVLRSQDPDPEPDLLALRRDVLLQDPALLDEAISGNPDLRDWSRPDLVVRLTALRDGLSPRASEPAYLVRIAATARSAFAGDRLDVAPPAELSTKGEPPAPALLHSSSLVSGPFDAGELTRRFRALWDSGHAVMSLPVSAFRLPPTAIPLTGLRLSPKGADLQTAESTHHIPWEAVHAVFYARVEHVIRSRDLEAVAGVTAADGTVVAVPQYVTRERTVSEPVLEIHAGEPCVRYRVEVPLPGLFAYLGRRRESSHAANLGLVAKDLVRFARAARFSHGLFHMMNERSGPLLVFEDASRFEDYVHWFAAMGSPAARRILHPARVTSIT